MTIVNHLDTVTQKQRITITPFVHFVNQKALVFFIFILDKFLRLEEVDQCFVTRLFHSALQFLRFLFIYTRDIDTIDLDFLAFINIDVDQDLILSSHILTLQNFYRSILVTLVFEIALDD